jgi:hypothetical protein
MRILKTKTIKVVVIQDGDEDVWLPMGGGIFSMLTSRGHEKWTQGERYNLFSFVHEDSLQYSMAYLATIKNDYGILAYHYVNYEDLKG